VADGAVVRIQPELMGVNPAWHKSLTYMASGIFWADGTSSSKIDALRANFSPIWPHGEVLRLILQHV